MGTRGLIGFRYQKKDYLSYNNWNSYPESLGLKISEFIRMVNDHSKPIIMGWDEIKRRVLELILVENNSIPNNEQKKLCYEANIVNQEINYHSESDWYCLLKDLQGNVGGFLQLGYMINSNDFTRDSLWCEYAYIINLDNHTLELYTGFNDDPYALGRYAKNAYLQKSECKQFYGIKLIFEMNLNSVTFDKIMFVYEKYELAQEALYNEIEENEFFIKEIEDEDYEMESG